MEKENWVKRLKRKSHELLKGKKAYLKPKGEGLTNPFGTSLPLRLELQKRTKAKAKAKAKKGSK